ncbi:acyl-CoA dehydrogenase [Desulfatirhabdium butyrativorans]|uniref:acyl-CoA dehydrogenase n=1 Tax=Desulfatirhabdium butyrativorans TaxID=340467 RepID=UPI0004246A3B|nr:acyl-CoA dehydrogenase [Desulfatirhabdium butyrativorans]
MAQWIADRRDVAFVLQEQFHADELAKHDRFSEFNRRTIDMIVTEARNLAVQEILPTRQIGDRIGCRYANGTVQTPDEFKRVWRLLMEGGWFAPSADPKCGGQGMPKLVGLAAQEYLFGANLALMMVAGLNHGAGRLIETFGTESQKRRYLENVYSGKWAGTMVLTEPEAGSDLSGLTTSAIQHPDGTYSLSGAKIFISGGEQDLTENIVYPVLARIQGAPEGSRGISLFLVSKFIVREDGTPGERNDIVCTGIEEKMGLHGSPTCSMALGSCGKCIGELLGEPNRGLAAMFLMMNEARLMVACQGLVSASTSYLYALSYARTRVQGKFGCNGKSVPIIRHPDVRRMLLIMKANVEGIRSLLYYLAWCDDRQKVASDRSESRRYRERIDLLIPVAKSYATDRAIDVCNLGIQVYGGYGYTSEYPVEQLLRDVRVTSIYEGTNGIQAIDFLGRKLQLDDGRLFLEWMDDVRQTIAWSKRFPSIRHLADRLADAVNELDQTAQELRKAAASTQALSAYSFASPLLDAAGDVAVGWMLLWRAAIASENLQRKTAKTDFTFHQGQILNAEFFLRTQLPVTIGKLRAIQDGTTAVTDMTETSFGGM